MNPHPQWNTPPNGDFARYVERLSAQAALPKRPSKEGEPGLDVGMGPSPGQQGPVSAAMQRSAELPNGQVPKKELGSFDPLTFKVLGVVGALVFLVLWASGVPFGVLLLLAGVAIWFGKKLKGVKLTPGVAKWQQVLEEAARKQREQQQKQGSKQK
ncbi:hypothetical protein [Variovorax sp. Root411]|uniref:hypothetical protein n=1 Tax=Variovorax sp. Root411 TaxID=1736530 RepID=UPI0006F8E637|nr:hypothetical protein [Variovorax sp. Root411]KQW55231.1 hypothetical protein ASC92_18515 [Variovorax sp. Root411]